MDNLANSEGPHEMLHYAAFHEDLHCLLRQNESSAIFWKNITGDPSMYTMDHPDFTVYSSMEKSIGVKRVKFVSDLPSSLFLIPCPL